MGKYHDLTGLKFGKLTAVSYAGKNRWRQAQWTVSCDCGGTSTVLATKLKSGHTKSCGCGAVNTPSDITGQRFGKLVAIRPVGVNKSRSIAWESKCDCGNTVKVDGSKLRFGHTKSCGCVAKEKAALMNFIHGKSRTPEHGVWAGMWQRCTNPKHKSYEGYGARGITVCDRWKSFENFYADMGERPSKNLSIERRDNDKGYEPGNCYWATWKEQNLNKRPRKDKAKALKGIEAILEKEYQS